MSNQFNMKNFYVYIYLDPRKPGRYVYGDYCFLYEPFYVGKGSNGRWKDKINGRNKYLKNKINKIIESNLKPLIIKIKENLNEEKSFILESKLIKLIGRQDLNKGLLINFTNGGEGISGYKHNEKTIESISKKQRKNFQEIKNEFEKRGYQLLTEEKDYKNSKQKLEYICPNGHKSSIRWNDFQQGYGCPYCAKNKIDFSEIKNEFEKRGYQLLTEEKDYKNAFMKLEYICPNGHKSSIRWNDFQQGHGCSCYRKKINRQSCTSNLNLPLASYEVTINDDPTLETISLTLFVAGCIRRCVGCQNKELQILTPNNHELLSIDQVKKIIEDKMCLIKSLTFCGGDFLPLYSNQLIELVDFCKYKNLKTILYTGELFENINKFFQENIDIIICGPYDHYKRTDKFPASSNQRCWIRGKLVNCDNLEINR